MKRILVLAVLMVLATGVPVMAEVSIESLLASSDIVLSELARGGAAVELVADPSRLRAGAPPEGRGYTKRDILPPGQGGTPPGQGGTPPGQTPDMPSQLIVNNEFTTDLTGWIAVNAYAGVSQFGSIYAPEGSVDGKFAVVHTGGTSYGSEVWQGSLEQAITVNANREAVFSTIYNFVTTELGAGSKAMNDYATITLTGPDGSIRFYLAESVHLTPLEPISDIPIPPLYGWGNQNGGQSGWLSATSDPLFLGTGIYTLRIEVNDHFDPWCDSAILLDRVGLQ
jgi:hypothetical protein